MPRNPLPLEVELFLQNVRAVPWGVLGRQLADGEEAERAPLPDLNLAFVDAVDLQNVKDRAPFQGSAASKAIYRHVGIEDDDFPDQVVSAIQEDTDALLHMYRGAGGSFQQVIHVAIPDLGQTPYSLDDKIAHEALANAYCNVFQVFSKTEMTRLRLVPLSAGAFSGRYKQKMPDLTAAAIRDGYCALDERDRRAVLDAASIELCIYDEDDLEGYRKALKEKQGTTRGAVFATPSGAGRDLRAELEKAAAEAEAVGLDQLTDEQLAVLLAPFIGDRPGSGHSQIRLPELKSPRKPAPDVSAASSLQALKLEVKKKKLSTAKSPRCAKDRSPSPKAGHGHDRARDESEPVETDASRQLHFDTNCKAKTVGLSADHFVASWRKYRFGGFALSIEPLKKHVIGRWFEVRIEEADASRWQDGLGIGVVRKPSKEALAPCMDAFGNFEGFTCELFPQHWMLGYDGIRARICGHIRYLTTAEMPVAEQDLGEDTKKVVPWNPSKLRQGDIVGLLVTPDGHMLLFVNEELTIFAQQCAGLEATWAGQVHAAVDLDGCIKTVRLLETNALIPLKVQRAHARYREGEYAFRQLVEGEEAEEEEDACVQDL